MIKSINCNDTIINCSGPIISCDGQIISCNAGALQEVELLRSLSFDGNIVQFYGACLQPEAVMMVLEYMGVTAPPPPPAAPAVCCHAVQDFTIQLISKHSLYSSQPRRYLLRGFMTQLSLLPD